MGFRECVSVVCGSSPARLVHGLGHVAEPRGIHQLPHREREEGGFACARHQSTAGGTATVTGHFLSEMSSRGRITVY